MSFKSCFGGLVQYMQYLEEAKNKSYDELMETINACDPDNLDCDQHSFEDAFENGVCSAAAQSEILRRMERITTEEGGEK